MATYLVSSETEGGATEYLLKQSPGHALCGPLGVGVRRRGIAHMIAGNLGTAGVVD